MDRKFLFINSLRKDSFIKKNINLNFMLVSLNQDGKGIINLFEKYRDILDWDSLFELSQRHKISGILINNLDRFEITKELPTEIQERINLIKNKSQQRVHQANLVLKQLDEIFTREGIPFLVLKGSVFANELYDDPAIRPFYDIDLLVHQQLLRRAEEILISLGYRFYCEPIQHAKFIPLGHAPKNVVGPILSEDVTKELLKHYHHHFQFVLPPNDKRLPIELHWHLFFPNILKIGPESLWECTVEKLIANIPIRTLNLEVTLLYLATIIAVDGPGFKLLSLCDFTRCLSLFNSKYNFQLLWQIADKWGAKNYLKFSLKLTKKLCNFDTSLILDYNNKKNILSDFCFLVATSKSAFKSALIERCARLTVIKKFICGFKKSIYGLFWDIAMIRLSRQRIRLITRGIIMFCQNKI